VAIAFPFWPWARLPSGFGWSYDARPKAHKQKSSFRVTADTIEANGQTFKKEDIHRLIIKNGMSNEILTGPTVLVPVQRFHGSGA